MFQQQQGQFGMVGGDGFGQGLPVVGIGTGPQQSGGDVEVAPGSAVDELVEEQAGENGGQYAKKPFRHWISPDPCKKGLLGSIPKAREQFVSPSATYPTLEKWADCIARPPCPRPDIYDQTMRPKIVRDGLAQALRTRA